MCMGIYIYMYMYIDRQNCSFTHAVLHVTRFICTEYRIMIAVCTQNTRGNAN